MRILITGASGLLGTRLVPLLLARGHELIVVSRQPGDAAHSSKLSHLQADVLQDPELVAQARAHTLIHLAWETTPGLYWTSTLNDDWREASLRLIQGFVAQGGTRVLVSGTCAEYRWDDSDCNEQRTPVEPQSPYAAAKAELRDTLRASMDERMLLWARVFFPYGPGEAEQRLLPQLIGPMLKNEPVRCSHGTQVRDYLHASDVARAFAMLCESASACGDYNIASGTGVTVRDIVAECARATASSSEILFGAIPTRDGDPQRIVGTNQRLRALGWTPAVSLQTGIEEYCRWARGTSAGD